MDFFVLILQAVLYGVVQGITEWLPVSSTGHMLLLDNFAKPAVSDTFWDLFLVVVQLSSIFAVVLLFWHRLWPFSKTKDAAAKKATWSLWARVLVASVPAAIIGILFEDAIEGVLRGNLVIAIALIVLGVGFLFLSRIPTRSENAEKLPFVKALGIGLFQALALIPGTSRSGSTIFGASLLGVDRVTAAEFSFFMAIPVMAGASALKLLGFIKDGIALLPAEIVFLAVGCIASFAVSLFVVRFLMDFVKKHSFAPFGIYRIVLGVLLLVLIAAGVICA
ncbi:MAG: undecaprenyl-diphosphate phosphatase [Clostridia bacterium]|nr:undecaprenyl-diphosphate phosphatase [Clostridia bacterium]